jgi:hypothetical protein
LAKTLDESASEAGISSPGAFAGTPEFASPEQLAGVGVDIRSDLYSLGVTLWEMVTGQTPFRGPSAEVLYQQQHAPLPLERLKDIPQPVVVLLEKLLEKDPAQRFQDPGELLKAIPAVTERIEAGRRITRGQLQQMGPSTPRAGTRRLPATRFSPKKISLARLPVTGSDVFGREEDIAFLEDAWANQQVKANRATGAMLGIPSILGVMAQALHLANRTSEALEVTNEAEAMAERFEQHWWSAELHRLRGVFLYLFANFCSSLPFIQGPARENRLD